MTTVLLPSLEVALSWLLFGLVAAGCGYLVRLALLRLFAPQTGAGRPRCADLWIGLAAITLYLLVWNDLAPVGWPAWLVPVAAALTGAAVGVPRLGGLRAERPSPWVIGLVCLATLGLADQALAVAGDYDFGLYHLGAIHYAEHYAAIPGLANLQSRFGAGDGHLLLVALLDHGPWAGAGPHLADGLLGAMLAVELGSRFVFPGSRRSLTSFTDRLALLLVPVLAIVVVWHPDQRIASPNLDFAAFVLVAVGMLYLSEAVERGFEPAAVLACVSALAAASATRPLYWLATIFAFGIAVAAARRGGRSLLRAIGLAGAVPAAIGLAWMARQAILSGYPLFPTTGLRLSVDWRVPLTVVSNQNDWDHAWARWPGNTPGFVLGSWHWVTAYWLKHTAQDPDAALPLLLLACLVPAVLLGRGAAGRSARTAPMLAVLVPSLVTLVAWFFIAPDPRFAWAPLWLAPLALTAWVLPDTPRRLPPRAIAPIALGVVLIVVVGTVRGGLSEWLVPAALGISLLVALGALRAGAAARTIAAGAVVTALLAGLVAVSDVHGLTLYRATSGGPLGMPPDPTPGLVEVRTASGLVVRKPAAGGDQCWQAVLCVPQLKVKALAMRGGSIADGFRPTPARLAVVKRGSR